MGKSVQLGNVVESIFHSVFFLHLGADYLTPSIFFKYEGQVDEW